MPVGARVWMLGCVYITLKAMSLLLVVRPYPDSPTGSYTYALCLSWSQHGWE